MEGFELTIRFRPSSASNYNHRTPALVATRIAVMKIKLTESLAAVRLDETRRRATRADAQKYAEITAKIELLQIRSSDD